MSDNINEPLIIQEQPRTEIYWGKNGHLAIKQMDSLGNEDPEVIFIPGAVPELIRRLQEEYDDYADEEPPVQPPVPTQSIAPPAPERMPQKPQKKKGAGS